MKGRTRPQLTRIKSPGSWKPDQLTLLYADDSPYFFDELRRNFLHPMATLGVFSENFKKLFFSIRAGLKITIHPNVPAIYCQRHVPLPS